jgi:electron transfer flavoprotein beta subunit
MKIIVCIKQVPNVREVTWNTETGSMNRQGLPSVINLNDRHAIESALQLREAHGGEVTVLSMGPPQVEEALREALGMGADEAIQLTDTKFAGSDTWATAYTLGLAIKKIEGWDLILCGVEAMDGNTAQVGPQVAEQLDVPLISYAVDIEIADARVRCRQRLGICDRILSAGLPALLTVDRTANQPRFPAMDTIMASYEKEIPVWGPEALDGDMSRFGLQGSPTRLKRIYQTKRQRGEVEMLNGSPEEAAGTLVAKLKEQHLI